MLNKKLLIAGALTLSSLASVAPAAMAHGRAGGNSDRGGNDRTAQWTQPQTARPVNNRGYDNGRRYANQPIDANRGYDNRQMDNRQYDNRGYDRGRQDDNRGYDNRSYDNRGSNASSVLGAGILGAILGAVLSR